MNKTTKLKVALFYCNQQHFNLVSCFATCEDVYLVAPFGSFQPGISFAASAFSFLNDRFFFCQLHQQASLCFNLVAFLPFFAGRWPGCRGDGHCCGEVTCSGLAPQRRASNPNRTFPGLSVSRFSAASCENKSQAKVRSGLQSVFFVWISRNSPANKRRAQTLPWERRL